jgi:hypothetical protein
LGRPCACASVENKNEPSNVPAPPTVRSRTWVASLWLRAFWSIRVRIVSGVMKYEDDVVDVHTEAASLGPSALR